MKTTVNQLEITSKMKPDISLFILSLIGSSLSMEHQFWWAQVARVQRLRVPLYSSFFYAVKSFTIQTGSKDSRWSVSIEREIKWNSALIEFNFSAYLHVPAFHYCGCHSEFTNGNALHLHSKNNQFAIIHTTV